MTDTSRQTASGGGSNFGLPVRTIAIPDSPSSPLPSPALSTASTTEQPPAPTRKGIRIRVNSMGAAVMFKNTASASTTTEPGPSAKRTEPPRLRTRLLSGTWRNAEGATPPSTTSTTQTPPIESGSGPASTSATSLPLPAPTTAPSVPQGAQHQSESRPASASSSGFNRRKFFGRSNSIRSLLGGGKDSASSSSIHTGSSQPSDASPGSSTAASVPAPHPLGRLRRMGSKSFLNLNQSRANPTTNSSSDDLSSLASADSQASRRFSNSIKGMGRRRGKSVSNEVGKSRSLSSQSSSEAHTSRMAQSDMLHHTGGARKSIESVRSSLSIASPDRHSRSSDNAGEDVQPSYDSQEQHVSAPRRLTGWLYNMVGNDNSQSVMDGGAPLSPVREADGVDFDQSSPTPPHRDSRSLSPTHGSSVAQQSRLKAGALFHSFGSGKATRFTNSSTNDNNTANSASSSNAAGSSANAAGSTSGGAGGGGGNNSGGWVPGGVGFDRAFKFFLDSDAGGKEDEGIWLLGVWHGPRQATKADPSSSTEATEEAPVDPKSAADVPDAVRASSPSSSISASSPRLIHASLSSSAKEGSSSRVGSSISTAPTTTTTSTSDSIRTRSSATSFATDLQSAFQPDFASRIWCTYRNHFAPISRDGTISEQAASAAASAAAVQNPTPSTPAPSEAAAQSSSPPASTGRGWLGRKTTESTVAQEAALQGNTPLGLGAALGAGYANASTSLGEKMGISNLWSRATAAAQAAGFSRAGLTTDSGWGCMLRTGQSLLANALVNVHLGRAWQRESAPMRQIQLFEELANSSLDPSAAEEKIRTWREKRARHSTYIKILSWFLDDPSPACPFGVHRMAREGKRLGKEVGEWFGPSTAAGAIKQLVEEYPEAGIAVEVAHDGVFYLDEIRAAGQKGGGKGGGWQRPVLILIGIRLGLDSVNPIYYESVKATFSFPHSVGIAGGRPSSSYYFMGHQGNSLFYLDPHNVRPAVPLRFPPATYPPALPREARYEVEDKDDEDEWWAHAYTEAQTGTFHCEKIRRMPIKSLDPSMLLGFLVRDEAELVDLCARIKGLPKTIFSWAESAPSWEVDEGFDPSMESFSEGVESDEEESDARSTTRPKDGQEKASESSLNPNPSGGEQYKQSQQRTADWLGRPSPYSHPSSSVAFPTLDPPDSSAAIPRPARLDARQVSTSSAATTRPKRTAASRSPGRGVGDESFSTVNHSDFAPSEGEGWEEVSDGGTVAASASAGAVSAVLRSSSHGRMAEESAGTWTIEPSGSGSVMDGEGEGGGEGEGEGEMVTVPLDTPTTEEGMASPSIQSLSMEEPPLPSSLQYGEVEERGLTSAHSPSKLPRRRSKPLLAEASPTKEVLPAAPEGFPSSTGKDLDGSEDDF